jgi:dolichol-phosphate mannosyltransferase
MEISIVLPTYNEAENIRRILKEVIEVCEKNFKNFEILVIDDNSPDGTAEEAKKIKNKKVKVFVRNERGLATAIKFGIEKAKYNVVCVMDADGQHSPKYIPLLYRKLIESNADIVIASRFLRKSKTYYSKIRKIISLLGNFFISILFPKIKSSDPLSGFFILKKSSINLEKIKGIGFKFLLELLAKHNLKVEEIPFEFRKREKGKSKLNFKEILNFITLLFHLLKETKEIKRIILFSVIGLSGVFINEFFLWLLTFFIDYKISSIIAIEISILWNFFLNDFLTFKDLRREKFLKRFIKVHVARIFGMIINWIVLVVLVEFFGIHFLISNLIGILMGTIINYVLCVKIYK